jgi:hypothetical protein
MKSVKLLLLGLIAIFTMQSCVVVEDDDFYNDFDNGITLPQLMEQYDLWYVDYNRTTGTGNIPFMSRAFTLSFLNGELFANNNLAGFGYTGNGFGRSVGLYDYSRYSILVSHDQFGNYEMEVEQLGPNEIKVFSRSLNVAYYLYGYSRSSFDYDRVFYDNIHYFLQEYGAWEKVYTSQAGNPNPFDQENSLQFLAGGNDDTFRSSQDYGLPLNQIYWDYTGDYNVQHVANNFYMKRLNLYYNNNDFETFNVTILNDGKIRLYHISSGTTYEFIGRSFIQYRTNGGRERTVQKFKK